MCAVGLLCLPGDMCGLLLFMLRLVNLTLAICYGLAVLYTDIHVLIGL